MLCESGELGYIHEPFCPNRSPGWITQPMPYWYTYISHANGAKYESAVERVLEMRYPIASSLAASRSAKDIGRQIPEVGRSLRHRARTLSPLLKDPFALFSSEWLADRFGVRPVVMIRKPVAFVSSIKKLNWGFDYERNWLAQDLLIRDHLAHHADSFRGYRGEVDLVGEGIVMWNVIYDFVARLRDRRSDFVFVIYEDLAAAPLAGYRDIYARLGLRWDEGVQERIAGYSDAQNPKDVSLRRRRDIKRNSSAAADTWKTRLTPHEAERVERETAEVAGKFYTA